MDLLDLFLLSLFFIGYPTYAYYAVRTDKLEWLFDNQTGAFRRLIVYPLIFVVNLGLITYFVSNVVEDRNLKMEAVELQKKELEEKQTKIQRNKEELQKFYVTYNFSGIKQLEANVLLLKNKKNNLFNLKFLTVSANPILLGELEIDLQNIVVEYQKRYDSGPDEFNKYIPYEIISIHSPNSYYFDFQNNSYNLITKIPEEEWDIYYVDDAEVSREEFEKYEVQEHTKKFEELLIKENIDITILGYKSTVQLVEQNDFYFYKTQVCELTNKSNDVITATRNPIIFLIISKDIDDKITEKSSEIYIELDWSKKYITKDSDVFSESSDTIFFSESKFNHTNLEYVKLCDFSKITALYPGS